jgi:hypothetical protein
LEAKSIQKEINQLTASQKEFMTEEEIQERIERVEKAKKINAAISDLKAQPGYLSEEGLDTFRKMISVQFRF